MSYPTMEQVKTASAFSVTYWIRHLPSPTDEQRPIMEAIIERRSEFTDEERIRASKDVGWD
jgi:hypothetical protein